MAVTQQLVRCARGASSRLAVCPEARARAVAHRAPRAGLSPTERRVDCNPNCNPTAHNGLIRDVTTDDAGGANRLLGATNSIRADTRRHELDRTGNRVGGLNRLVGSNPTLSALAAVLEAADVARACHEAGVRHQTTPAQVRRVLQRQPNVKGHAKLRVTLDGDSRSPSASSSVVF